MSVLDKIPVLNIFTMIVDMSKTGEIDGTVELPQELEDSSESIEEQAKKHFNQTSKGNSGKGKGKSQFKVESKQLNSEKAISQKGKEIESEERDGR